MDKKDDLRLRFSWGGLIRFIFYIGFFVWVIISGFHQDTPFRQIFYEGSFWMRWLILFSFYFWIKVAIYSFSNWRFSRSLLSVGGILNYSYFLWIANWLPDYGIEELIIAHLCLFFAFLFILISVFMYLDEKKRKCSNSPTYSL